jgi:hypothetical protein
MVIIITKNKDENIEKIDKDEKFNNKLTGTLLKKNPKRLEDLYLVAETLDKKDKKLICEDARPKNIWKWILIIFGIIMLFTISYVVITLAPQIIALFNRLMGL